MPIFINKHWHVLLFVIVMQMMCLRIALIRSATVTGFSCSCCSHSLLFRVVLIALLRSSFTISSKPKWYVQEQGGGVVIGFGGSPKVAAVVIAVLLIGGLRELRVLGFSTPPVPAYLESKSSSYSRLLPHDHDLHYMLSCTASAQLASPWKSFVCFCGRSPQDSAATSQP